MLNVPLYNVIYSEWYMCCLMSKVLIVRVSNVVGSICVSCKSVYVCWVVGGWRVSRGRIRLNGREDDM